jgi:pyruvate dehydrogenase E2 component (dihydrolipoamide acetyltransferase)
MPTEVILPKLEMAQESATIIEWLKAEGEEVEKGEPLVIIETDKVSFELESPGAGALAVVRSEIGEEIPVTTVIAYLLQPGEEIPDEIESEVVIIDDVAPTAVRLDASPIAKRLAKEHDIDLATLSGSGLRGKITKEDVEGAVARASKEAAVAAAGKVRAAPAARRLAREKGLDLTEISGSGPRGQVTKEDVVAYASSLHPHGPEIKETIPLRGIRRRIAERMTLSSQTSPHISVSLRTDMSNLEIVRSRINAEKEDQASQHVSVTAMITKVLADVIERHPWLNSTIDGDQIHLYDEINIGVAVAIDEGLIVPVVKNVNHKRVAEIAEEINDLATRARGGSLTLSDVSQGTFTISNLGPFGIEQFTAIINPPQAAILALGAVRPSVLVDDDGGVIVRPTAWMTLSTDHRIVDGAVAAKFLKDLAETIESMEEIAKIS